jgi:copper chaperone for superoxide dismutase
MVQVSATMTILDMTLKGVSPGTYNVTVRESGDISAGAASTGRIWDLLSAKKASPPRAAKGILGSIEVGKSGLGSVFLDRPIQIWEIIGRSIVVSQQTNQFNREDPNTFVGVIARSAGVWDNDKTVCSCSGKTVWEERKDQTAKGML